MTDIPILHNWAIIGDVNSVYCIIGEVYNDSRRPNGRLIRTSSVVSLDEAQGIVKTQNTLYDLGRKLT